MKQRRLGKWHPDYDPTYTAMHESGHAVVAVRLDLPLQRATVRPVVEQGAWTLGCCDVAGDALRRYDAVATFGLGGMVATARAYGWNPRHPGNASDMRSVRRLAKLVFGPPPQGDNKEWLRVTQEWVDVRLREATSLIWGVDDGAAVGRVRLALARKMELTGDEVRGLVWAGDAGGGRDLTIEAALARYVTEGVAG